MTICHDAVTRLRGHRSAFGRRHEHGDEHPGAVRLGLRGNAPEALRLAASNVPGVGVPLYLGGSEMLALYGFGPCMGTAANITLVSYRDTAFIGFNVDRAAIPDIDVLVDCVDQFDGARGVRPIAPAAPAV